MDYKVVFNTGTSSVVVDEDGRMAHPGDWTPVLANPVLEHELAMGTVVDRTDDITDKSALPAWEAKRAAQAMAKAAKPPADPRATDTMSAEDASSATTTKAAK